MSPKPQKDHLETVALNQKQTMGFVWWGGDTWNPSLEWIAKYHHIDLLCIVRVTGLKVATIWLRPQECSKAYHWKVDEHECFTCHQAPSTYEDEAYIMQRIRVHYTEQTTIAEMRQVVKNILNSGTSFIVDMPDREHFGTN